MTDPSPSDGRIDSILRFPIKSFQGESIPATQLGQSGIFADRQVVLRDIAAGKVLSAKHPRVGDRLLELTAEFSTEPAPGRDLPTIIAVIDGTECSTEHPDEFGRLCSEFLGIEVELQGAPRAEAYESYWPENAGLALSDIEIDLAIPDIGSYADLEPLHILTTASLRRLADLAPDSEVDPLRFRPSLLIDTGLHAGFVENDWEGRTASLGAAVIRFGVASPRCIVTTRPQPGLARDTTILQTLARENRRPFHEFGDFACLGIYAQVIEPGPVAVGDHLLLT